jgi:hypothetical protein
VIAATAAFAIHSGFDFVWHLPAIVLTVTLLVGLVLPAPDPAPAHQPSSETDTEVIEIQRYLTNTPMRGAAAVAIRPRRRHDHRPELGVVCRQVTCRDGGTLWALA